MVNALPKIAKWGLAGCHMNGTVASNWNVILRTTRSVIARCLVLTLRVSM